MALALLLVHVRDETVLDNRAVLFPVLAVLPVASLKVAAASMSEDCEEEERVEVRDGGREAGNGSPEEGLSPVGSVVDFACESAMEKRRTEKVSGYCPNFVM